MSSASFGTAKRRPRDLLRGSAQTRVVSGCPSLSNSRTDLVRAAQNESTQVWLSDLRNLLSKAEERFADISWSTASTSLKENSHLSTEQDAINRITSFQENKQTSPSSSETLIWAHKAILYARAPNTFHTKFLQLKTPTAQLEQSAISASLVSLPLHSNQSHVSVESDSAARKPSIAHKTVRGAVPPSSFSLTKRTISSRKSISTSAISRPFRNGSTDDVGSWASDFMTSDSENEGPSRLTRSQKTAIRGPLDASTTASFCSRPRPRTSIPIRKPSFTSSDLHSDPSTRGEISSNHAPLRLEGVSPSYFRATLQYLYTGEEAPVDDLEFLFGENVKVDAVDTPDDKLDKLRSDLTYMWRSKLYSDVKLSLDTGEDDEARDCSSQKLFDIPDATMSITSLPHTHDTDFAAGGQDDDEDSDNEKTTFSAHRMILASRSPYFASLLLSPYADAAAPVLRLPAPPFTAASLHFALGFLYTGTLFFSNRTFDLSTAFSIWRAGAYLQIGTLQSLVVALIDREFCHGFTCSPPCRRCVKRVPRALVFAAAPDVSELSLQESALNAVAGTSFGMYWARDVGNLDLELQDSIADKITTRLHSTPSQVISVLRQLSIVGQKIDAERSSPWVESLRLMAETVENRVATVLQANLEQIVTSKAWSDLLDGVDSLSDVLEKCLVMLLEGLTESRAAKTYEVLVGQVLLRDQGFEVLSSRQVVENTRASILRYLKKRWINIRALSGFNQLQNWCLKEIADELDLSTADLLLPDEPVTPTAPKARTSPRVRSSLAGVGRGSSSGVGVASTRRTSSTTGIAPNSSSLSHDTTPRASALAGSSRLRSLNLGQDGVLTPTVHGTSSTSSSVSATFRDAHRLSTYDDTEREAGSIHLRAAVLNRNAAKTSVTHGHRASNTIPSANGTASARPPMPKRTSSIRTVSQPIIARQPLATVAPAVVVGVAGNNVSKTPATGAITSRGKTSSLHSNRSLGSGRTKRSSSGDSLTARKVDTSITTAIPSPPPSQHWSAATSGDKDASITTLDSQSSASASAIHAADDSSSPDTRSAATPPVQPTFALPDLTENVTVHDSDKTPTKSVRSKASDLSLRGGDLPALGTAKTIKRIPSNLPKSTASSPSRANGAASTAGTGPMSKSAFLRATPGPGGTFSLSSTDSGRDLRARTISGNQGKNASPVAVTATVPQNTAFKSRKSPLAMESENQSEPTTPQSVKYSVPKLTTSTTPTAESKARSRNADRHKITPSMSASSLQSSATSPLSAGTSRDTVPLTATTVTSQTPGTTQDSEFAETQPIHDLTTPSTSSGTILIHQSPLDKVNAAEIGRQQRTDIADGAVVSNRDVFGEEDSQKVSSSGITLLQPIPCIVCPQVAPSALSVSPAVPDKTTAMSLGQSLGSSHRATSAQHRFSANVKYIGAIHGHDGLWIGLEVPLPLPFFLVYSKEDGRGDIRYDMAGSDGTIDGKRYFSLSHHWDISPAGFDINMSSVPASAGSRASSATFARTPSSEYGTRAQTSRRYQYPESDARRERRRKVCQMATNLNGFTDTGPYSPEDFSTSMSPSPPVSIGMFVRPRDILLVVGGW